MELDSGTIMTRRRINVMDRIDCEWTNIMNEKSVTLVFKDKKQIFKLMLRLTLKLFSLIPKKGFVKLNHIRINCQAIVDERINNDIN